MNRILTRSSRKLSAAAKVNSDREILGVTKNASLKGFYQERPIFRSGHKDENHWVTKI